MPSLSIRSPKTATALTSCVPNKSSVIHWGASSVGAILATHFVPRFPSTAWAGAYWPLSGANVDDACTPATATRRRPGSTSLPDFAVVGMS